MNQVQIVRVVVASPVDVQAERDALAAVIDDLNKSLAIDRALRLELVRWETDASPGFHPKGPQWLIDSFLRIDEADVVIGIFWKRFGTPVDDASSGTAHELRLAHDAWSTKGKPQVMVYFRDSPYAPKTKEETDQWGYVLKFKSEFPREGLWWAYSDLAEFERLLRVHLMRFVSGVFPLENRDDYLDRYSRLIQLARQEIILSASKFHRSEDRPEAARINHAIRNAVERGVSVRMLTADGWDRLPAAIELQNDVGAEVRFDKALHLADLNYLCVDGRNVILASRKPSPNSGTYFRSTSSVEIQGSSLATALQREFEDRWNALTTQTLQEHLKEALPGMIRASSVEAVARVLGMPREFVESCQRLKPSIILLIGRPGSGKTTVAAKLRDVIVSNGVFTRVLHLDDMAHMKAIFGSPRDSGKRFEKVETGGFFILDSSVYDEGLEFLANQVPQNSEKYDLLIIEFARNSYTRALQILLQRGVHPDLVIYLDVSLTTALERNLLRARRTEGTIISFRKKRCTKHMQPMT